MIISILLYIENKESQAEEVFEMEKISTKFSPFQKPL